MFIPMPLVLHQHLIINYLHDSTIGSAAFTSIGTTQCEQIFHPCSPSVVRVQYYLQTEANFNPRVIQYPNTIPCSIGVDIAGQK